MKNAKYVIEKSEDGQFYFTLIASNGEPLSVSEMYPTKSNAKRGIEAMHRAASTMKVKDNT